MNKLDLLYQNTLELQDLLDGEITSTNRQEKIEEITALVNQCNKFTFSLTPPYSEEEMVMGQKIIAMNQAVEAKLKLLFADLKQEMRQVQKQKKIHTIIYQSI
ncbi:flagellar protein FliT [Virgibacillus sp. 179-BFC.A HS]|uniref:Flagellar protein FliT n=1 Tax=Tigheibacillus jepli TaxID=3035914 RepID=A0ABU5CFJ6_9BACI|nr:flagellar protein FliT [Virgibacillus sp. 179-BFC.A HS]MDY0405097.1 flagellar protein FliT [Virgibacillus sp. 179-BFC.A HS]